MGNSVNMLLKKINDLSFVDLENIKKIFEGELLKKINLEKIENIFNQNIKPADFVAFKDFRNNNANQSLYEVILNDKIYFKIKEHCNVLFNKKLRGELFEWKEDGDEWSDMAVYDQEDYSSRKDGVYQNFILPYCSNDVNILEIAMGNGRWTDYLLKKYKNYIGVDISKNCVDYCKKKYNDYDNVRFLLGNGLDLKEISDESIDFVFSFDSFVHIEQNIFEKYIREISRILKKGGNVIIHHSGIINENQIQNNGYRSSCLVNEINKIIEFCGMSVVDQKSRWGEKNQFSVDKFGDIITSFKK